jgi:signal transduction histidine kinase
MLLDSSGNLLASSDSTDAEHLGQPLQDSRLAEVLAGQFNAHVDYSQYMRAEVADVFFPVVGSNRRVLGVVRLTRRFANVYEWFQRLRYLIAGVLAVGLFLGAAVGWVLALNLEHPLRQVARAVDELARGRRVTPLPESGLEEIQLLSHAFNSLMERSRVMEQNRRQLLANLVHELGRPLGALHSAIQALLGGADEQESLRQELLVGMDGEVRRLGRLVDDLARLHDQVAGTLEIARQPVALSDWLVHALAPWREAAQGKGLRWEADIASDLPILDIDPDRLAQAVSNLTSNAIKYTRLGGVVSVAAGVKDKEVWIQVSDTGPGIPLEEQPHIFTRFFRGRMGRRFPQGMGLGLSIARDLVVAHGGRLEMKTAPGRGSDFTLWLPLN